MKRGDWLTYAAALGLVNRSAKIPIGFGRFAACNDRQAFSLICWAFTRQLQSANLHVSLGLPRS